MINSWKGIEMHEKFKELLDEEHDWPAKFHFKFIVPTKELEQAKKLLQTEEINLRSSRNQKFTSLNAWIEMGSSEDVIDVYTRMQQIPGVISL